NVAANILRAEPDGNLPHDIVQVTLVRKLDPAQLHVGHVRAAATLGPAARDWRFCRSHALLSDIRSGGLRRALRWLRGWKRRHCCRLNLLRRRWRGQWLLRRR